MNIAIIPARGGSRRIPRKNVKEFHGRPIIAYSIEAANACGLFDRVIVSTDDYEIAEVAVHEGAEARMRSAAMCEDAVGTQEVTAWALRQEGVTDGLACCIYATAPLMSVDDLRHGHRILADGMPYYVHVPGWYYWGRSAWFLSGRPIDPDQTVSVGERWIDINTPEDWARAEAMYAALHKETACAQ